jgi:hypothetical protein
MEHQFDELAKAMAEGVSRREALRRLGSGVAAATLAALGLGNAWGQSRRRGRGGGATPQGIICPPGEVPCAGGSECCPACPNGEDLCGSKCCTAAQVCCPGSSGSPVCTFLGTNTNCGGCNNVCPTGTSCVSRQCVCDGSGQPPCNGVCCPADRPFCNSGSCSACPAGCSLEYSIEGQPVCVRLPSSCQGLRPCATSSTCGSSAACIPSAGCVWRSGEGWVEYNACVPRC